jgi:hypothetical protein
VADPDRRVDLRQSQRLIRRPAGDPAEIVRAAIANLGELRLSRRDAAVASIFSVGNWGFDSGLRARG